MIFLINVKKYCCDDYKLIENYEKAMSDTKYKWHCHHRLEIDENGTVINTKTDLIQKGLYWKRPHTELIFVRSDEHHKLHGKQLGASKVDKQTSEFGKLFYEKYGFGVNTNRKLYQREYYYYRTYKKLSDFKWEC